MFSKAALFTTLTLAVGFVSAAPPPTIFVGDAKPFIPSGLSACGTSPSPDSFVAGVSTEVFNSFGGGNANFHPICGRTIQIHANGKVVTAQVENSGGDAGGDLILSHPAFSALGDLSAGLIPDVHWFVVPL